jgi:hypothetical protein
VRELIIIDVVAILLRETVEENASVPLTEGHKGSVSAPAPLAGAWYALLDKPAPEIGVDQPTPAPRRRKASYRQYVRGGRSARTPWLRKPANRSPVGKYISPLGV